MCCLKQDLEGLVIIAQTEGVKEAHDVLNEIWNNNKDTKVEIDTSKMEEISNHGKVKKIFKGSNFDFGYYAFVDKNGEFVIGEERGREGGELYRGVYKGKNTPWLNDIKKENIKLYNSIVSNLST